MQPGKNGKPIYIQATALKTNGMNILALQHIRTWVTLAEYALLVNIVKDLSGNNPLLLVNNQKAPSWGLFVV